MRLVYSILKLLFLLTVGLFVFVFMLLVRNTLLPRWPDKTLPSQYGIYYEEVNFYSKDKVKLKGWLILKDKRFPTIVLCHGLGTNKSDLLSMVKFIYNSAFNLFLFDFRGHGESQGKATSFGYLEQKDLEGAIDYLYQRVENKNIGVFGLSFGGAVAIMLAGRDERIKAVVSDSAYGNLYLIMLYSAKAFYALPKFPVNIFLKIAYFLRFGVNPENVSPEKEISKISPRPVFIIHGEKDKQVPLENAYSLFKKAGLPKEIWIVPDADHGESFALFSEEYSRKIIEFFRENMK
ncbi:MAG: alpha/beta hydrolase [Candidatus Omnitrophota bacterium]